MSGVKHMLVCRHNTDTCGYIQLFHFLKTTMVANMSVVSGVRDCLGALEVLTLSSQHCFLETILGGVKFNTKNRHPMNIMILM